MNRNAKILLIATLTFFACDNKKGKAPQEYVAKVGDKTITEREFEEFLAFKRIVAKEKEGREKILKEYVEREALAKAIENERLLDKSTIEVELNEFRKEMIISRYFEKFLKEKVTKKNVKNYYNAHSAEYEDEKVKVAHILIRVNDRMDDVEKQARITRINEAYSKLRSGDKFEDIVKEYSEDKVSNKKGGDIGWIKKGAIDDQFSKTAFSIKEGEYSEPFKTKFGYHIALILEGKKKVKRPFRAVEGDIRYQLREQAKKEEMARLRKKVNVEKR